MSGPWPHDHQFKICKSTWGVTICLESKKKYVVSENHDIISQFRDNLKKKKKRKKSSWFGCNLVAVQGLQHRLALLRAKTCLPVQNMYVVLHMQNKCKTKCFPRIMKNYIQKGLFWIKSNAHFMQRHLFLLIDAPTTKITLILFLFCFVFYFVLLIMFVCLFCFVLFCFFAYD